MVTMDSLSDDALMLVRGKFSTVRAAHEDALKEMSVLCGLAQSLPSQALKRLQPANGEIPASIADLAATGRKTWDDIEALALKIESLSTQRHKLKPLAWPKG